MALMTTVGLELIARNRANRQISSFNRSIQRMGRQMLMIAGVGGGLYAIHRGFRSIIKAASDAQETQAKFDTVFKDLSKTANQWAESFGESVGRSRQSVKSWMAGLQDTFVPLGIARDEALELAKSLTTLAVDVASFNNAVDADVIRDFTSALVGNHETVRKFGIIISETALKQEALRQGINKTYKELTDLEKVQLRYNLILSGTTDAQGDALRTAGSYANQVKRLTANFDNLKVTLGNEILPALTELVKAINENEQAVKKWGRSLTAPIESLRILIELAKLSKEISPEVGRPAPFGGGVPGLGDVPKIPQKVPKIYISPWGMQQIAEMRAFQRRQKETAREQQKMATIIKPIKQIEKLSKEAITAQKTMDRLSSAVQREIEITGRLGEAHWHAAKMVEFEEAVRQRYPEQIERQSKAIEEFSGRLKELEKAQRLARIADEIGDAFGNAFEKMIFEANNFRDVMRSLFREIAISVVRQAVIQPFVLGISGAISGGIGGMFGGMGRTPTTGVPGTFTPNAGVMPVLQGGGAILESGLAVVHRGETVNPPGRGGGDLIIQIENKGQPMQVLSAGVRYEEDKRIIALVVDNAQRAGPVRHMVQEIIANVE